MSNNKTIKNFTAADIEKYWNKELSASEMLELEKAAMEDPFLADALEGYRNSKKPGEEIIALKEKLNKRIKDETPVIPLLRKKYYWFRVAAAIIILVGSGLLIQQLLFKNKDESPVAIATTKGEDKIQSDVVPNNQLPPDTLKNESTTSGSTTISDWKNNLSEDPKNKYTITTKVDSLKHSLLIDTLNNKVQILAKEDVAVKREDEKKEAGGDKNASVLNEVVVVPQANNNAYKEPQAKARAFTQNAKPDGFVLSNRFNYRIIDAQNNPVPFANVMNTRDNVGTYTDVRGYFNLVSSDSVLNVQVKSLGFNSENYKLVPSNRTNDLILKEDATARYFKDANQSRQRVMSNAVRKDSAEIVEPEVGWGNYNTYVENNIKIPEKVRSKNAINQVELSFDVDKTGTPVNIAITKSSQCKECDEEAIRLLKEGPKWKKKGKRSKTTISISVDQK